MRRAAFLLSIAFIFITPWENAIMIPGLGTLGKAVGLAAAAVWLLTVVLSGRLRALGPFHVLALLFVLWNALAVVWSIVPNESLQRLITYAQLLGLVFLLWDLYDTPEAVDSGLQAYVAGAYVAVLATIGQYVWSAEPGQSRYSAPGDVDPNDLGLGLALAMPLAWHLASTARRRWPALRLINYLYIPAGILAIVLTASRTALICSLVALSFPLWSLLRARIVAQVVTLVVLLVSLLAVQSLVPESSLQRLATAGESIESGDLNGRVALWGQGLDAYQKHPLVGVGSKAYKHAIPAGKVAHNVFISVLVELGIIGLGLFLAILVVVLFGAVNQPRWHSRLWLTMLATWGLGVATLTWEYRKPTWLVLSFAVCSAALQRDESETPPDLVPAVPGTVPGPEPG
jgi:hypothetical protein